MTDGGEQERGHGSMWAELIKSSLVKPREAARKLLSLDIQFSDLIEAAIAVTCLGVVLGFVTVLISQPRPQDPITAAIMGQPLLTTAIQLVFMVAVVGLTHRVGAAFGGSGSLHGALTVVVWLSVMMLLLQAVQIVALAVLPPVTTLLAVVIWGWLLFAFASFVAELHGFSNTATVLGGTLVTGFLAAVVMSFILAMLGFTPQGIN